MDFIINSYLEVSGEICTYVLSPINIRNNMDFRKLAVEV